MEYVIEFFAELAGALFFKQKPEEMPDDVELQEQFTVTPYRRSAVVYYLTGAVLGAVTVLAYIGNGIGFACLFGIPALLLLVLGPLLYARKYEVDVKTITVTRCFFFKKTVEWNQVTCVKQLEKSDNSSVTLALFFNDRLAIDFVSPMKNFWQVRKLAEHLGYEIIIERDAPLKKYTHP